MAQRKIPEKNLVVLTTFHENVPDRLIRKYNAIVKAYRKQGGYQRKLAKCLGINFKYLNDLLVHGIEPTDRTEKGQKARITLFLPIKKKTSKNSKAIQEIPEFMKQWNKLSKEERYKVIQQYLTWKVKNET